MRVAGRLTLGLVLSAPLEATAMPRCEEAAPWSRLQQTAQASVHPAPLGMMGGAALTPVLLAPTGLDHDWRHFAQTDLGGRHNPEPLSLAAPWVLLGGTLAVHGISLWGDSCRSREITAAMLQGATLTLSLTVLSKWGTGRGWPNGGGDPTATERLNPDFAQDFAPFERGLAAFPSGHTSTTFALAAALWAAAPEWGLWRYVGYPLGAGVAFGMWYGDHHFASDIISGALLGQALGSSAGQSFRATAPGPLTAPARPGESAVELQLWPAPGGAVALAGGRF